MRDFLALPSPHFRADDDAGTATADAPAIDYDALARSYLSQRAEAEAAERGTPAGGARPGAPDLNSRAGQEEGEPQERAAHAFRGRSVRDLSGTERDDLGSALYQLLQGQARKSESQVAEAVQRLARMGHYGPQAMEAARTSETRALSTLTDADGAVFLPEVVLNEVQRLIPDYGVIRRLARIIPISGGSVRVPNLAAGLVAFWVGEGQEIKARKPAFGKKSLDPEKMGIIIPWTTELEEETGSAFLNLVIELASEAFALLEDQTGFYGDGSAAYGGITGLANAAGVVDVTMPVISGGTDGTSIAHLTHKNLLALKFAASSRVRERGRFVLHPNSLKYLLEMEDTTGRPIIKQPTESAMLPSLYGSPIEVTEAVIGPDDDAGDTAFAFFGDFSRFLIGQGRGMTSDLLTEATIKDVDDETLIYLGMQDMKALRMTQRLDMTVALANAFARLKTGAVATT